MGLASVDGDLRCEANAFNPVDQTPVHCSLLINVLEYFQKGVVDSSQKVHRTSLPPLYFQHPGKVYFYTSRNTYLAKACSMTQVTLSLLWD